MLFSQGSVEASISIGFNSSKVLFTVSKNTILLTLNILQFSMKDFLLHRHGIALRVFVSSNPL
mgnify:FL=1